MYTLKNEQLQVSVLDPVEDRVHLGFRYCTGGYIWQVEDHRLGPLLSGPEFPNKFPNPFNGQGLPEAFADPLMADPEGDSVLVVGVGRVNKNSREVQQYCEWAVTPQPTALRMETTQTFAGWSFSLTREVVLAGRTVKSETRLRNIGQRVVPFRWYPHPFFPLTENGECCRLFFFPVSMPENPGYALQANGFIGRKLDHEWDQRGHYQLLDFTPGARLAGVERHPLVGLVGMTFDYVPVMIPIWGNSHTFSIEPYLGQIVAPNQEAAWSVTYDF